MIAQPSPHLIAKYAFVGRVVEIHAFVPSAGGAESLSPRIIAQPERTPASLRCQKGAPM